MPSTPKQYLYLIFGIVLVLSAIAYISKWEYAVYCFAASAVGMLFLRVSGLPSSADFRVRRLRGIQLIATVLLVGTAYLMYNNRPEWAIALLLSAALDLLVSLRMPKE